MAGKSKRLLISEDTVTSLTPVFDAGFKEVGGVGVVANCYLTVSMLGKRSYVNMDLNFSISVMKIMSFLFFIIIKIIYFLL